MKFLCIFFLFLITLFFSQGNPVYFSKKKITQEDGLSQGSNYFRFEDRKGFMWITCNDALNRYDGSSVKVYNLNRFFKNCPALQQGYGFAEDEKNLYIGSTRGLYVYDYEIDTFSFIDVYKNISTSKTAMPIGFSEGKIWIFNETYQLVSFDVRSKKIKLEVQVPIEPIKSIHVYDNEGNLFYFRMPFIDKHNNICFIGKNEVAVYNLITKKSSKVIQPKDTDEMLCSAYDKKNDQLFIGTQNKGILVLEKQYQHFFYILNDKKSIGSIAINEDNIFFNSDLIFNVFDRKIKRNTSLESNPLGYVFGFDKVGRLWSCDDGVGQIIMNFKGNMLQNYNDIQNGHPAFKSGVGNFTELSDGKVLIQSEILFDYKTFMSKTLENSSSRSYQNPYSKDIWMISNHPATTFEFERLSQNFTKKIQINIEKSKFGVFQNMTFFKNSFPLLAFSTGLFWLNTEDKKLEKITSLPKKNSFFISKISGDRIAVSYLNGDMVLAKLHSDNSLENLGKILPGMQSFYLQEYEKKQQFWAGTNEGVFLLDKNFKILKKFDSNNGLAGTYIYGILMDDFGKIWCSHQRGLSSIDTENYSIINFDKNDGIQHWDFNNRAFLKTSDGTLFFGGVNGFNFFKPPLQFKSFYKPEIYFDEIRINNAIFSYQKGLNSLKILDLKNDENNVTIKAFIKDLEFGEIRELMYRIKSTDHSWKKIPKKTPLILTGLAPGKYEVEFAYTDKFSKKIISQKSLQLNIQKAFYQSYWFWGILGGLFFGGIIYAVGRWKLFKQKNEFSEKMALEKQREKITADLHDDIGSTLSSLQINSVIANQLIDKQKLPEAKNVLIKIENQSQKLSENIGDFVWSMKPNETALMTLSTRIRNFANEILGNTNINYHIKIDENIDQEITDFAMRKNIILIVKEALNNAAKYSNAKDLQLNFVQNNSNFLLKISDDGIGFELPVKIGNGLQNMKKRAEEMNGIFEITSTKGTHIKISIPKIRDQYP